MSAEVDLLALIREGFALAAGGTIEESRAWLARLDEAQEQAGPAAIAAVVAEESSRYTEETGLCPWCGGAPCDQGDF